MRHVQQASGGHGIFLPIVIFAWVFVISLTLLNVVGFVPYYIDGTPSREVAEAAAEREAEARSTSSVQAASTTDDLPIVLPTRLVIPAADTDVPVANPNTTDIAALDEALLTAVVRYPGSGTLGRDGNMFIFGHSTGYRTVHNPMYKAFNALKTLEEGNVIKLTSGNVEYVYTVRSVEHRDAAEVTVDFATEPGVQTLTLSTCDSFGSKSDRYIVTADFVGSYMNDESAATLDSE